VARVYPGGELSVSKTVRGAASRPPRPRFGPRFVRGVSARGRRVLRRAVMARSREGTPCQWVLLTLTSQAERSDTEMRACLARFLSWGRDACPEWFGWYVWVAEDQARGVLHFHLLVSRRIPKALFRRVRAMWCDHYGMGPGGVDVVKMRHGAKAAVTYLTKYLAKSPRSQAMRLDPDGTLQVEPWPVSRHTGEAYVRDRFRGNPYGMADAARYGAVPVTEFYAPWGAFPGLDGWHAGHVFHESSEAALGHLQALLGASGPGPPLQP
jgi:hypothetical protein